MPCLYIPYHLFQYLESSSMILELNSFEDFYQISENIKNINQQYQVILSQDTYLSQMNAFDTLTQQINYFIVVLLILVIISFCINQLLIIYNQKYEIAILKANGLSYYEIMKMILYWICKQMMKSFITISLFIIFETFISYILRFQVQLTNPTIIFYMCGMLIGIYIFPALIATICIAKIDVEKLLRF